MTIQKLEARKQILLSRVNELTALKKKLYSDVDITSPMGIEERELTTKIAGLFSEINSIVIEKRKIKTV